MTLLEIMIAVAVLGIAMMATFLAVVQGEQLAARSDEESLALQAAEQVIQNLRAGDFSDFPAGITSLDQLRQTQVGGVVEFTPCAAKGAVAGQGPQVTAAVEGLLQPHVDGTGQTLPVGAVEIRPVEAGGLTPILVTVQWRGDDPNSPRTVTLRTKVP